MKNRTKRGLKCLLRLTGKACITAALTVALAFSGALSVFPGIGDAFKPLTAHATDYTLQGGTYTLSVSGGDQTLSNGSQTVIFTSADKLILNGATTINLDGNKLECAQIYGFVSGAWYDLTIHDDNKGTGAIEINGDIQGNNVTIRNISQGSVASTVTYTNDGPAIYTHGGLRLEGIGGDSVGLTVTSTIRTGVSANYDISIINSRIIAVEGASYGMQSVLGNVNIDGTGKITVTGGTRNAIDVRTGSNSVTIKNGATVTATNTSGVGYGISGNSITVDSAMVTASGNAGLYVGNIDNPGTMTFKGNHTRVEANGKGTLSPVTTGTKGGAINIEAPLGIVTPAGGVNYYGGSGARFIASDDAGTIPTKVVIEWPSYNVTVTVDGSGTATNNTSAPYHENDTINLSATPGSGAVFDRWEVVSPATGVTLSNPYSASTSFQMPAANVEVKAYFQTLSATEVAVTVTSDPAAGGTAVAMSGGAHVVKVDVSTGGTFDLTATPAGGYRFDRWEVTGGDGTPASTTAASTTFNYNSGTGAITIVAHFVTTGGGGGTGGGGTTPTPTPAPSGSGSTAPVVTDAYVYTAGQEQTWIKGSGVSADFTVKHTTHDIHTYSRFTGIQVDGVTVDRTSYATAEGSVVIALTPAYLETLAEGRHTLLAQFSDGSAETTFTVLSAAAPANMTRVDPPQTSDTNAPVVTGYSILFLLSLAGMCAIVWRGKRIR